MIKIIQFVTPCSDRFLRTVINDNKVVVFIEEKHTEKVLFCNNKIFYKDLEDGCKKILKYAKENNLKNILLTVSPFVETVNSIKTFLENPTISFDIFYCQHGILHDINKTFLPSLLGHPLRFWAKDIGYIVCGKRDKKIMKSLGFKNVKSVRDLVQFSKIPIFENPSEEIPIFENPSEDILIINGSNTKYYLSTDILEKLIKIIRKYYSNKIIIKNKVFKKGTNKKTYCEKLQKLENVQILNDDSFIYDYLNSKFIVIVEGGTAVVEAFLANLKVIQFGEGCWYTHKKIEKYLMFTTNYKKFDNFIRNLETKVSSELYKESVRRYLEFLQGKYEYENIFEIFKN